MSFMLKAEGPFLDFGIKVFFFLKLGIRKHSHHGYLKPH